MAALASTPAVLSALLLGAHFLRAGQPLLLGLCLGAPLLLLVRRPWVPPLLSLGLLGGSLCWVWTGAVLARQRLALGEPWLRMALILGGVALFTAGAALAVRSGPVRRFYRS